MKNKKLTNEIEISITLDTQKFSLKRTFNNTTDFMEMYSEFDYDVKRLLFGNIINYYKNQKE